MGLEAINPIGSTSPVGRGDAAAPASVTATGGTANFAQALSKHLEQPRAQIAQVRAEVSSIRDGGALRRLTGGDTADFAAAMPWSATVSDRPWSPAQIASFLSRQATGDTADPYGWREMSRQIGDSVIGPGYGPLFERQMQQESGFAPEVVTGQRRSSAGAEGIAQLMPQYYQHVNRRDPQQSLQAGALTMQQHLTTFNGDVRKALASYNAGSARVESAVAARGAAWESALPQETRDYLAAIVGGAAPVFTPAVGGLGGALAGLGLPGLPGAFGGLGSVGAYGAGGTAGSLAQLVPSMMQQGLGGSLRALSGLDDTAR